MAEKYYSQKEFIFRKGDPGKFACVIKQGLVEILKDYPEHPIRLALLQPGDVFGEMGLINEEYRLLTARAITETYLLTITRDELIYFLQNNPNETLKYLQMFFEKLQVICPRVENEKPEIKIVQKVKGFEVQIFPTTQTTDRFLPLDGYLIESQMLRIGRSSNSLDDVAEDNDLIMTDTPPYNLSRNHFAIEKTSENVIVHDRGSFLGTIVNGQIIGGHNRKGFIPLKEGENEIIAGSLNSPFRFRVMVKTLMN